MSAEVEGRWDLRSDEELIRDAIKVGDGVVLVNGQAMGTVVSMDMKVAPPDDPLRRRIAERQQGFYKMLTWAMAEAEPIELDLETYRLAWEGE